MKNFSHYQNLQQACNAYVRSIGRYNRATHITVATDPDSPPFRFFKAVRPGYRKFTTGEYVPNSYRSNFGWRNTYYQHAETHVEISPYIAQFFATKQKQP